MGALPLCLLLGSVMKDVFKAKYQKILGWNGQLSGDFYHFWASTPRGGWQKGRRGSFHAGFLFRKATYSLYTCLDMWHVQTDVRNVSIATPK